MTRYIERPPEYDPTHLLDDLTPYEPVDFDSLPDTMFAGSIIRVEPILSQNIYVFECTGAGRQTTGGYENDGYLIHYSFDETNQILDSGPQTPAVLKLSLSVPRATFTMVEGSTTNHIMPPDSHIGRSFSAKLAQSVLAQAMYLQHVETLNDPEAQTILNEITQYLTEAGESLGDESLKRAAALLLKNLSTDAET